VCTASVDKAKTLKRLVGKYQLFIPEQLKENTQNFIQ
jgi:hypothetical protein